MNIQGICRRNNIIYSKKQEEFQQYDDFPHDRNGTKLNFCCFNNTKVVTEVHDFHVIYMADCCSENKSGLKDQPYKA